MEFPLLGVFRKATVSCVRRPALAQPDVLAWKWEALGLWVSNLGYAGGCTRWEQ